VLAVLNAELALSMLGGGGSLLGGQGGPTMSALAAFKNYQKDQVSARKTFMAREDIKRDIDSFKRSAGKLQTVDDLLKDRKALTFVLSAFGLESEINNPGKLKAVLNSDPDDINSFANRLADGRFGQLAAFLDTPEFGMARLRLSDKQSELIDNYLTNAFEKSLAAQNPAMRDAMFFLRRIGTVANTYEILGDLPLRTIVTETLNLPREIARQSVERQAALINAKLKLDKFQVGSNNATSRTKLDILNSDLASVSTASRTITAAQNAVNSLVTKLEDLRKLYAGYDALVDPAGDNAAEIAVQQAAIPDLLAQRGLVAAADGAVKSTRATLNQLDSLYAKVRKAADADELATAKAEFLAAADKILGDSGFINGATYTDPNTGETRNLLRNGTAGPLPPGIDPTANKLTTTVATDGTKAVSNSNDLAGFLDDLQAFRDGVAGADFATLAADLDAAVGSYNSAKTTFKAAEFQNQINVSSITNALGRVKFAAEVDSASLALGLKSTEDALSRAQKVEGVLTTIRTLARDAQKPDADLVAINDSYTARVAELQGLLQNAGSVTDGTTTVALDNLLTDGSRDYNVLGGAVVRAEGGDLANAILAGLPADITVGNAQDLVDDIDGSFRPALTEVVGNLTRDKDVLNFAANRVDPRGALDGQIRQIQADLDRLVNGATVDKKNLLLPFATDLRVTVESLGSSLTINAQPGFKGAFSSALESFETSVLSGGSIDDRLRLLNDALFTAGRTQSALKAETYALNIQRGILTEQKKLLDTGGDASNFLKPVEYTKEALKFIERYLVQKDMESQGVSTGTGKFNPNAALAGQIQSLLPLNGGLNLLA